MGIDGKYGRVTVEHGTIADDEPVVVFRAQDALLPKVLIAYHVMCHQAGSPEHHLRLIEEAIRRVEEWQEDHYHRTPSSDSRA